MRRASLILVGAALALAAGQSRGQDSEPVADTGNWTCRFCTYANGWFGSAEIGLALNSDAVSRYTDYRGLSGHSARLAVDGSLRYREEDGTWLDLAGIDLGAGNRRFALRGGRRGNYTLWLDYGEVSKHRGFGAQTPFQGVGGNFLALPAGWVPAGNTGGMTTLGPALQALELETERRTLRAGLDIRLSGAWRYEVELRHMEKNGLRAVGAGVFTVQSTHFPVPVYFSENRLGMALNYGGDRSNWRFSLDRSWFNNGQAFVTWQNPFAPIGNTSFLRTSLEPDSEAWRVGVAGTFSPRPGLRLSAQASAGRSRQDDALLPYSINPDFDELSLPRTALGSGTDLRSLHFAGRLGARLSSRLRLNFSLKADDRDNRTPVSLFTPVITDLVQRPETPNRPYSFERRQYSLDLDYRLGRAARLNWGIRRVQRERRLQSVRETRQDTWWGEINFNQWSMAQLRLRLESSDREISPYDTVNDPGLQENPLLRKFNLAGRDRRRVAVELDVMPGGRFNASLAYYRSRDNYRQSVLGLLDSDEDSLNLDLAWSPGGHFSAHAFASLDHLDSNISGAVTVGSSPWSASTGDRFRTFGAGISGKPRPTLDIGLEVTVAHAGGMIATDSGEGEAPFPELANRLHSMRLWLAWHPEVRWGVSLSLERERYESSDWQIDGIAPDGLDAILALGARSPDTRALFARIQAHYRF